MPLSVMRGRSLTETTTYTYDDQGRIASTRTVKQPLWLESDQLLALGLGLYERSLCDECGQHRDLAHHPDMDGWFEGEAFPCFGCDALHKAVQEVQTHNGGVHPRAMKYRLRNTRPADLPLHSLTAP